MSKRIYKGKEYKSITQLGYALMPNMSSSAFSQRVRKNKEQGLTFEQAVTKAQNDREIPTEIKCRQCKVTKPISEYTQHQNSATGHKSTCEECRHSIKHDSNKQTWGSIFGSMPLGNIGKQPINARL